jgi:CRP-like cAMP-binding protein
MPGSALSDEKLAQLRSAFERYGPLSDAAWIAIGSGITVVRLAAGESFIRTGELHAPGAYVYQGLLQANHVTDQGREYIHAFLGAGEFATAYKSAITGRPSQASFEALEPTELWCFDVMAFRAQLDRDPEWCRVGRKLVEQQYIAQVDRIEDLLVADAAERFSRFLSRYAALVPRLQQQHVARYLGITPESLSRLRKARRQ